MAEKLYLRALAMAIGTIGRSSPEAAIIRNNLGQPLARQGEHRGKR